MNSKWFATKFTQCNLNLLKCCSYSNKCIQTIPIPKKSIALQARLQTVSKTCKPRLQAAGTQTKTDELNVTSRATQCCLDLRQPFMPSCSSTQTEEIDEELKLPKLLSYALSSIHESQGVLSKEICRNARGEYSVIFKPKGTLGIASEDVYPVQLVLTESGKCSVFTVFKPPVIFNLMLEHLFYEEDFFSLLQPLLNKEFVYCPGVSVLPEDEMFKTNSVIVHHHPFFRMQHENCPVWYERMEKSRLNVNRVVQCPQCISARGSVRAKRKRKTAETPASKKKRLECSSNCNLSKLTPSGLRKRFANMKRERRSLMDRVRKLEAQISHRDALLMDSHSPDLTSESQEEEEEQ